MNILYINNNNHVAVNTVTALEVDPTGTLVPLAQPSFGTGGIGVLNSMPGDRTIVQSGKRFLFVTNQGDSTISAFRIGPGGRLRLINTVPTGLTLAGGLAVTPDGRHIFAGDAGISFLEINRNGALSPVTTTPWPNPTLETAPTLTPNGMFLVTVASLARQLMVYSLLVPPPQLGLLLGASSFSTGFVGLVGLDFKPTGVPGFPVLVFVGSYLALDIQVRVFLMAFNGGLSPVPGSPFIFPLGSASSSMRDFSLVRLSPDGKLLFVGNVHSQTITLLRVDLAVSPAGQVTGQLTPVPGSPFAVPSSVGVWGLTTIERSDDGRFLFVANYPVPEVAVFGVGGSGTLTLVPGSPFASGNPNLLTAQSGMVFVRI